MTKHYSPLRYPGGKNCIFPFVSKFFYENGLIGIGYAEPYAGGAGLALRLLFEEYVDHIYINDLDPSIYAFWDNIIKFPDMFCDWIADVDVTIENWMKYKEIQNNLLLVDSFELAKSTFFLNRTNISGVIKGGIIGGYAQKGKYKIDVRFNKDDLIHRIQRIATLRHRISISNYDGLKFIDTINRKKKDIFIYLDPPYYQKGADLYMNFYLKEDHEKLSNHIQKLRKKWMISYDNNEFILNLYSANKKVVYQLSQCASNRIGDEVLIFSKQLCFTNSIDALKSPIILP
ncbi:MAG: DNA adenine methylase [Paludibacteraceae bacterium]|nr:DNA adenine methylase [Paludibacteraceae bacterium]